MQSPRAAELAERLSAVHRRIEQAVSDAGRTHKPELIVVTKYFPAADLRILAGLGVTTMGESRDQEAAAKAQELKDFELHWHFIGQLQTNKARSVARYADAVHSVDRAQLVRALGKAVAAGQAGTGQGPAPALSCFIQVDLSIPHGGETSISGHHRGGAAPADVLALGRLVDDTDGLALAGVMAVAPLGIDPAEAFGRLACISASLRVDFPAASGISAGMSGDLEAAVAAGATHLRIGSQVLGDRPPLR
ncbi:YggS family pyridoxal phosphate-dependent enzyme [Arthrobacter sp. HLT1-21]